MPSECRVSETVLHEEWLRPAWERRDVHAFMTTRAGGLSVGDYASMNIGLSVGDDRATVLENRARVSAALGAPAVFLWQVHGNEVLRLRPEHAEPGVESTKADAAISTDPALGVAVQAADCLPVLFATSGGRTSGVGGAHAGWRGLAAGVLENTVAALCAATGRAPGDIDAWLGACIGPEAFEVGAEVRDAFAGAEDCFVYRPNAAGEPRWRADLAELARRRLRACGVTRLSGGTWCTYSEPSRFFSFRRDTHEGRVGGRMVAAIRLLDRIG